MRERTFFQGPFLLRVRLFIPRVEGSVEFFGPRMELTLACSLCPMAGGRRRSCIRVHHKFTTIKPESDTLMRSHLYWTTEVPLR